MTALDISFLHKQAIEVRTKAKTLKQRAELILADLKSATTHKPKKQTHHHGRVIRK